MTMMPASGTIPNQPMPATRRTSPSDQGLVTDAPKAGKHRVGPNAIIQTRIALEDLCGPSVRNQVFELAGLGVYAVRDPEAMVDASLVNRLNRSVAAHLSPVVAHAVMRHAGERTADYILANRIPPLAKTLLGLLPRRLAVRLLIKAVARNSWTFAGNAAIRTGPDWIAIVDNPVCLGLSGFTSCVWQGAVFTRLFRILIGSGALVEEVACGGRGDPECRFTVSFA